jgi:hypothetical protein
MSLKNIWGRLLIVIARLRGLYTIQVVEEEPEKLRPKSVYLVGEKENIWYAVFACPCGCNERVYTKFVKESRPRWSFEVNLDNSISLSPSVWRNKGCKSHFFLRKGKIQWCRSIDKEM